MSDKKNFLVNWSCQKFRHMYVVARFSTYCKSWLSAYCLSCWFNKSFAKFAI